MNITSLCKECTIDFARFTSPELFEPREKRNTHSFFFCRRNIVNQVRSCRFCYGSETYDIHNIILSFSLFLSFSPLSLSLSLSFSKYIKYCVYIYVCVCVLRVFTRMCHVFVYIAYECIHIHKYTHMCNTCVLYKCIHVVKYVYIYVYIIHTKVQL